MDQPPAARVNPAARVLPARPPADSTTAVVESAVLCVLRLTSPVLPVSAEPVPVSVAHMADGVESVLVTGSSSGFGRVTAEVLARSGRQVFATMRDVDGRNADAADALQGWAVREGAALDVLELELTDEASIEAAVEAAIAAAGRIDVVVNNAGVGAVGYLEAFTVEQFAQLLDVNLLGAHRVNRAVLPHMREQGSGLLIHISSNLGRLTVPFMGAYTASKHALEALAEVYRYELRPLGIDSVIVEPGGFPTEIFGKIMESDDETRLDAYSALDPIRDRMFQHTGALVDSPGGPDPREVADAVLSLIDEPVSRRPLRTVVGSVVTAGVEEHNESASVQQRAHLASFGVAEEFDA